MLRFRTFGAIDLRRADGERLDELLGQPKRLALLAYLAAEQPAGPIRREQLLALLWPESAPSDARHALSSTLSRLRNSLGEDVIRGSGEETLWLDRKQLRSDVARFQEAVEADRPEEALSLYQGPFLEGFRLTGARAFEEWAEDRRQEFRSRAYEAGIEAGEAAYERGDLEAAEECFRRAHEIDPLKQDVAERLIRVLVEQGERGEALQFYDAFTERLREELDLKPSGELKGLAERVRSQPARSGITERTEEGDAPAEPELPAEPSSPWTGWASSRRFWAIAAAAIALAGVAVWWGAAVGDAAGGDAVAPTDPPDRPTLAVLPFESLSPDSTDRPFAAGLHEDVLTRLAQLDGLSVLARTSVEPYQGTDRAISEIADQLGADAVLEASVRHAGSKVRVSAQLIDGQSGAHIWAKRYDRQFSDVFDLQADLARRIAASLEAEIRPDEQHRLSRRPTRDTAAYSLYLRARALEGRSREENETAIELLRQAIRLDSSFAAAHAELADAYLSRTRPFGLSDRWVDSAAAEARRAIALDSGLADAHKYLGTSLLVQGRPTDAIRQLRRALELAPENPGILNNLGGARWRQGRYGDAYHALQKAARLAPRHSNARVYLAHISFAFRRDSLGEDWLAQADRLCDGPGCGDRVFVYYHLIKGNPGVAARRVRAMRERNPDGMRALTSAALVHQFRGNLDRARRLLERADEHGNLNIEFALRPRLAQLQLTTGDTVSARRSLQQAEETARTKIREGSSAFEPRFRLAAVYTVRDAPEKAMKWFRRAYEAGWRQERWCRADPLFASLRKRPAFQRFLDRVHQDLLRMRKEMGL